MERYPSFLDKTQAIAGNDRSTHTIILQNTKTSQDSWNSASINTPDINQNMVAIGRKFQFPLEIELYQTPHLKNVHNSSLFYHLRHVSADSVFNFSVIQNLISDRRTAHQERQHTDKIICNLKVGDVVKVHVQVLFCKQGGS